jgi:hypothetical protein
VPLALTVPPTLLATADEVIEWPLLNQEHIELGRDHQRTFVPPPSALLQVGVDRHHRPSSLP